MKDARRFAFLKKIGPNRAVLALSSGRFGDGMGNSLLFIVIPLYIAQLPAPHFPFPETVRAGILLSLFGLVAGLFQPLTGALVDRLNRRKPFIVGGLALLACATVFFSFISLGFVTTSWALAALRVLQGIASGGIAATVFALAGDLYSSGGEGRQMSMVTLGFALGIALGTLCAGLLAVFFLTLLFISAGLLALAAAWWVYRRVPETVP